MNKIKTIKYENKKLYIFNNIDDDKLNKNSEFMIGSISKVFTIYILLILNQKNIINIYGKVDNYDFTIFDLINHMTGLKSMPSKIQPNKYKTASDAYNTFKNEELLINKKNEYKYSNIAYILLGHIIEKYTNKSYLKIFRKYIFKPLKMNHTNVGKTNIKLYMKDCKKLTKEQYLERYFASTGGGFYSCIYDLIIFAKNIHKLLNEKSLNILKTLYIYKYIDTKHYIQHDGYIPGGGSVYKVEYDENWKTTNIYIKFETNT